GGGHSEKGSNAPRWMPTLLMAQCEIRGGVHQRLPKRSRRGEQLASVLHVLQSRAASSSVGLSHASAGLYEQIRRIFSNGCVLSYFRPQTVLTFGTTINICSNLLGQ